MNLKGKFFISGKIETLTGLHIGGLKETLEIGGVDSPVIRARDKVYIPGSSLKGKIRSLLERKYGKFESSGKPCGCGECEICKIFGPHRLEDREEHEKENTGNTDNTSSQSKKIEEPTRIIVRDADCENEIETEIKPENIIDRVKGTANPRQMERVPVGTMFKFEIIFNIYEKEKDNSKVIDDPKLISKFIEGMELLEDDYLGGSGSRGYGKIKFKDICLKYRPKEYYEGKSDEKLKCGIEDINKLKELLKDKGSFEEIF